MAVRNDTVIYFAPVDKTSFQQWEYYQVDLRMLQRSSDQVVVCHSSFEIIRTLIRKRVMYVYCWWWSQSVLVVLLCKLLKVPVFVTGAVHMYDESGSPDFLGKGVLYRLACRLSWRFADLNFFISKSQYRQITSHENVNNPNVLKSSLPSEYVSESLDSRVSAEENNPEISLLTIVWMTEDQLKRKCVFEVLNAIKLLANKNITNFEWTIAGKNADGVDSLLAEINRLDLNENITLLLDISNQLKTELYMKADLYLQPSYYEGFGNAVLEAMSYGVPALVSSYAAQPEVVLDSGIVINEIL